jgi:penicillin-binding protein-related factor A (putative recombinase)
MLSEAEFQTQFSRWAKYNLKQTCAWELKFTKEKSLPYNHLAEHQEMALKLAKHGSISYKIADVGQAPKPFDGFTISSGNAFVVPIFYRRGVKVFYLIDIDAWCEHRNKSSRKSITEPECEEIGLACHLA